MRIKKVYLNNIRSYEKAEIEFPLGKVLLSGNIGSGKSTILLAVEFVLFGLQRGSLSGSSLLRNGTDNGRVQVEFDIDGNNIIIERTLKRGKKSIAQNSGYIIVNNERKEFSAEELRSFVLQLLNYPIEFLKKNPILYSYTVYTPQEEMKQILLEDVDTRVNTLRRVFAIDRYKRLIENTAIIISKLREEIRNKEGLIAGLEIKKEEIEGRKEDSNKIIKDIEKILPQLKKAFSIVNERKEELNKIENKFKEFNKLKTEFAVAQMQIKTKEENVKVIEDEIKKIISELKEIKVEDINKLITELSRSVKEKNLEIEKAEILFSEINRKIAAIETKKEHIDKLRNDINKLDTCPLCKQKVTDQHKEEILSKTESELKNITTRLKSNSEEKEKTQKKLESAKKEFFDLQKKEREFDRIKINSKNLEEKKERKESLTKEITQLKEKIKEFEKNIEEFKTIDEDYNKIRNSLDKAVNEEKEIEIAKVRQEKELEAINNIINSLQKEILEKEKVKVKLTYFNKTRSWLTEKFIPLITLIEKNVMATLHVEFNAFFEKWFDMLVTGDLTAKIDENFTPIIEQQGYDIDYAHLSGGERTAAALAYRLALNQVINSLLSHIKTRDILILDEPTDGFSSEQLDKMRDILQEISAKQIILVSHESKIEDFVDNIIRFEKKDNLSRIIN